jgi:hypothetical protein
MTTSKKSTAAKTSTTKPAAKKATKPAAPKAKISYRELLQQRFDRTIERMEKKLAKLNAKVNRAAELAASWEEKRNALAVKQQEYFAAGPKVPAARIAKDPIAAARKKAEARLAKLNAKVEAEREKLAAMGGFVEAPTA